MTLDRCNFFFSLAGRTSKFDFLVFRMHFLGFGVNINVKFQGNMRHVFDRAKSWLGHIITVTLTQ